MTRAPPPNGKATMTSARAAQAQMGNMADMAGILEIPAMNFDILGSRSTSSATANAFGADG
ncbi:hypothetical protein [Bradyrhizobium sp. SYSU BS000235]|uniref:hypothetical protein n=1 Tax=Bradyrhizobium sp. SYSU BS000235 TaxID=3411332 RepID=UPI003C789345